MKAVLDTNILISAVISTGMSHEVLVKGFEGEYELLISPKTVQEFEDTLLKYPDKFHLSEKEVEEEVDQIEYFGQFVLPEENISKIEVDPSDNMFLEAAVAGDADYIVSGDHHLQDLSSFRSIEIVDPRRLLELLNNTDRSLFSSSILG